VDKLLLGCESRDQSQYLRRVSGGSANGHGRFLRLAALVSANIPQCTLVLVHKVPVPRRKVTDEVDVVRLVVMHRMEVIVTVDRVQGAVVGELLLGDGRVVLKAKDGSDVILTLDGGQFTPIVMSVRHCHKIIEHSALTHHSFLTRGFSQHSVLFETALSVKGLEGAATTQEAEAKAQTVAEVKRISRLMIQYGKKRGRALPIFIAFPFFDSLLQTAHAPYASVHLGYANLETD